MYFNYKLYRDIFRFLKMDNKNKNILRGVKNYKNYKNYKDYKNYKNYKNYKKI